MAAKVNQRLSVAGDNIDSIRDVGTHQLDDYDHIIHKTKAGTLIIYKRASDLQWDIVEICTKVEADTKIRSWITQRSQVIFTPDHTNNPGTTHTGRIMNDTFPMRPWSQSKWRGTLRFRVE